MARLHPVVTLPVYERLVRRRRLVVHGEALLEAKLDGYLAIVYDSRVYTGSGRRAPQWMLHGLSEAGLNLDYLGEGVVAFVELYGRCASPGGFHRSDSACYRAALVDSGKAPAYSGGVAEAALLARFHSPEERLGLAEAMSAETPLARRIMLQEAPEPWELREILPVFRDYEGFVVKLYAREGHVLPPDYGFKTRGVMEVKVKHQYR